MAANTDSALQEAASIVGHDRRCRGASDASHTVAAWNRAYADLVKMNEVSGHDKAKSRNVRPSSPTSSGNSGSSSSPDDTSQTTASRHRKGTSHSSGHPTPSAAAGSDGFTSSQADGSGGDGSGGDGSGGDGSGSGSDSPQDEGFRGSKDMTPLNNDAQDAFHVECHNNVIDSLLDYSDFEMFGSNQPLSGGAYQTSGIESLNRHHAASESVAAPQYLSFVQPGVEQSGMAFNLATLIEESELLSTRSTRGNNGEPRANLARLLDSVRPRDWTDTTTVMLRNIPAKYNRQMLLKELEHSGFVDGIDLLYLPIVKKTSTNRGYAFINFIAPQYAWAFKYVYDGRCWESVQTTKIASVTQSKTQGFDANCTLYGYEWLKSPEARPWINTSYIPSTPPFGVPGVRHHSTLDPSVTTSQGASVNSPMYQQEITYEPTSMSAHDFPMELMYL